MNPSEKRTILLVLVYKDDHHPVQVARNEYHSLMSLISDHLDILGFGLCSGMGSCGTCMVTICSRNGEGSSDTLSCGVAINDGLANTQIIISEGRY